MNRKKAVKCANTLSDIFLNSITVSGVLAVIIGLFMGIGIWVFLYIMLCLLFQLDRWLIEKYLVRKYNLEHGQAVMYK